MNILKRKILNAYYSLRFRKKNFYLAKNAYVVGRDSSFEGYNRIGERSVFRGTMGRGSYIGRNSQINATVGRYCCISDRVNTVSGTHPTSKFVSIHPAFYAVRKKGELSYIQKDMFKQTLHNPVDGRTAVYIGNDVWIGSDVTLLGGIKIGDGAVIAAGAVVTKDVAPYTVVGGVPAKPVKKRFTEEEIAFLCNFCWWEKEHNWIKDNSHYFLDIKEFMKRYNI